MQIFGAIVNSINIDKLSPEDVCQKIQESTLSTINTIFAEFEASPDELENVTSIEKMIGIDNLKQRAVAYFLYKLCNEQDQEITVELEEFAYNYIMTKLIIFRVLYYNTETKRLGFDKKFIADVLPHSEFWKYNHTWSDRLKNKLAYRKMTKNED